MIISDNEKHKVDVIRTAQGWLQITTFHLNNGDGSTEWKTKVIRLSPQTVENLYEYIKGGEIKE